MNSHVAQVAVCKKVKDNKVQDHGFFWVRVGRNNVSAKLFDNCIIVTPNRCCDLNQFAAIVAGHKSARSSATDRREWIGPHHPMKLGPIKESPKM